jgi:hypothetical protein
LRDPQPRLREAVRVLHQYHGVLARQIADEIADNTGSFGTPFGQAENMLTKYATQIHELAEVYRLLRFEAWMDADKPQGREPLAKEEFRCFGCGEVIDARESACKLCGWSWR